MFQYRPNRSKAIMLLILSKSYINWVEIIYKVRLMGSESPHIAEKYMTLIFSILALRLIQESHYLNLKLSK